MTCLDESVNNNSLDDGNNNSLDDGNNNSLDEGNNNSLDDGNNNSLDDGNNNSLDDGLSGPLGTRLFSPSERPLLQEALPSVLDGVHVAERLPGKTSTEGAVPYIDFQELKSRVSIEQAIQLLGLQLKPAGTQLRGPCPTCKFGGDRVLVVTPSKGMFYCFAAQTGGDQIALVAHVKACKTNEAAAFLNSTNTSIGSLQNS